MSINTQLVSEASRQTCKISPVLLDINRSFKLQNTISLKTGVLIKVFEMHRFALVSNFSARESFYRAVRADESVTLINFIVL